MEAGTQKVFEAKTVTKKKSGRPNMKWYEEVKQAIETGEVKWQETRNKFEEKYEEVRCHQSNSMKP